VSACIIDFIKAGITTDEKLAHASREMGKRDRSDVRALFKHLLQKDGVGSRLRSLVTARPSTDDGLSAWLDEVCDAGRNLQEAVYADVIDNKKACKPDATVASVMARLKAMKAAAEKATPPSVASLFAASSSLSVSADTEDASGSSRSPVAATSSSKQKGKKRHLSSSLSPSLFSAQNAPASKKRKGEEKPDEFDDDQTPIEVKPEVLVPLPPRRRPQPANPAHAIDLTFDGEK
jgi:hypothetical protein